MPILNFSGRKCLHFLFLFLLTFSFLGGFLVLDTERAGAGNDYYVDGNGGSDSNPGTLAQPWRTIGKANNTLRPGDTVYIRSGNYSGQQIRPKRSGTNGNRILYSNYKDETPVVRDVDTPLYLSNRNYVTIHGIKITDCDKYLIMTNGHYNEFSHLEIGPSRNYEKFEGFQMGPDASYNWLHHSTISRYGVYENGRDRGDMVYIGDGSNPGNTHHNIVEDNHFYYGGHNVLGVNGKYNIIRDNYFHNEEWQNGYGGRISVIRGGTTGGAWNLVEGNRWAFTGIPPDNNYSPGLKLHSNHNIVRKNMFYHVKGPGLQLATLSPYDPPLVDSNYVFHNDFFYNGLVGAAEMAITFNNGPIKDTVIKNNIFHKITGNNIVFKGKNSADDNTVISNWQNGDPKFRDASINKTTDSFDQNYPNFRLQSDSPCIDEAEFLTTAESPGNGNVMPVVDAHYFIDGWGMSEWDVQGDAIKLENGQMARITDVDYENNVITVNKSLNWSNGEGVSLVYEGAAPDLGAYEYGMDGYNDDGDSSSGDNDTDTDSSGAESDTSDGTGEGTDDGGDSDGDSETESDDGSDSSSLTTGALAGIGAIGAGMYASNGLPYQFGGDVTYYQPACTSDNPSGTCPASCQMCTGVLGSACTGYQEIRFSPAGGSQPPNFICVKKGFQFKGGMPRMGGQIIGAGASNVFVWEAAVSQ